MVDDVVMPLLHTVVTIVISTGSPTHTFVLPAPISNVQLMFAAHALAAMDRIIPAGIRKPRRFMALPDFDALLSPAVPRTNSAVLAIG